ncbi:hypothetical protein [Psychroserpens sp.]
MRISKFILLAMFSLSLFTCGSDDDSIDDTLELTIITPSPSIANVDAILALPADSDITDLVSFGQATGVSTADVLSVLELNDQFVLQRPAGLLPDDIFIYENIYFYDEIDELIEFEGEIDQYLELIIPIGETADYYELSPTTVILQVIDADIDFDLNWKYDIECYIERGGVSYGPFIIDPKMRVKRKTTLDN